MPGEFENSEKLELDLPRYELRRGSRVVKLEKIPMELLILLAEKQNQLVTRDEIIHRLWGKDVFLDTEQGVNTAIRKIRLALRDDPEQPRYLQTIVGKGYRFIAPIQVLRNGAGTAETRTAESGGRSIEVSIPPKTPAATRRSPRRFAAIAIGICLPILLLVAAAWLADWFGVRHRWQTRALPIHSLAVLPLANLSGDPAQDYFADGMTDELITQLAKIGSLRVISRTSIVRFKTAPPPLPEIARQLNVDAIVEGSVVRSGNRVRITAQLIYAPTDRHLWAEEYDRDERDVLALQSEVARAIAQQVRVALTPEENARLRPAIAVNPDAYEHYLRGRAYWNQRNQAALTKAIEEFQTAISTDANYPEAYSGLADCYTTLGYLGYLAPNDSFPRAQAAAAKALELDPNLAEAHASLAYYNLYYSWNFPEAEREFQLAIATNPNYATAHDWYSYYLMALGRQEESWKEINRARELDPLSVTIGTDIGFNYFYRQEYDQAIAQLRAVVAANPKFAIAHLWLGRAYQQKKMYPETIVEFQQVKSVLPTWVVNVAGTGNAYAEWGKSTEARAVLAQLDKLSQQEYVTPYGVALVYVGLGDKDSAFAWLNKAVAQRSNWLVWLNRDPRLNSIRSDPRFDDLKRQVGVP